MGGKIHYCERSGEPRRPGLTWYGPGLSIGAVWLPKRDVGAVTQFHCGPNAGSQGVGVPPDATPNTDGGCQPLYYGRYGADPLHLILVALGGTMMKSCVSLVTWFAWLICAVIVWASGHPGWMAPIRRHSSVHDRGRLRLWDWACSAYHGTMRVCASLGYRFRWGSGRVTRAADPGSLALGLLVSDTAPPRLVRRSGKVITPVDAAVRRGVSHSCKWVRVCISVTFWLKGGVVGQEWGGKGVMRDFDSTCGFPGEGPQVLDGGGAGAAQHGREARVFLKTGTTNVTTWKSFMEEFALENSELRKGHVWAIQEHKLGDEHACAQAQDDIGQYGWKGFFTPAGKGPKGHPSGGVVDLAGMVECRRHWGIQLRLDRIVHAKDRECAAVLLVWLGGRQCADLGFSGQGH